MAREKKQECEEGAPKWMVTFSDLVTLLLTFFVLLLSFSTISEEEFNEAMMSLRGAFGIMPRFSHIVATAPRRPRRPTEETAKAARRLRRQLQVAGQEKQVRIEYDALGGLKLSLPSRFLFTPGSANLRPESLQVLQDVAEILGELPETFIEVRGHTDATPVGEGSTFQSNYDLSYFRASAVTDQLVALGGVPAKQFEIVASGPNQPIATNQTEEGRQANRRVEIFVRGLVSRSRMEELEAGFESLEDLGRAQDLPVSPQDLDQLR